MSPSERVSSVVTGAVIGVLVVLAAVFGVVFTLNANYVTRLEYVTTVKAVERSEGKLDSIVSDLAEIKGQLKAAERK
jgi:hypothetical protein